MQEHKDLMTICDTIGHGKIGERNTFRIGINILYNTDFNVFLKLGRDKESYERQWVAMDVREIIFSPEFMDKYGLFILNKFMKKRGGVFTQDDGVKYMRTFYTKMFSNLKDPVQYLLKLLDLGKNKKG